uniref:Uncharacterized protein n=1 Tax=Arundo donax TaxID=35708 RepID=A0A0A9BZJ6_ARUDO
MDKKAIWVAWSKSQQQLSEYCEKSTAHVLRQTLGFSKRWRLIVVVPIRASSAFDWLLFSFCE